MELIIDDYTSVEAYWSTDGLDLILQFHFMDNGSQSQDTIALEGKRFNINRVSDFVTNWTIWFPSRLLCAFIREAWYSNK